MENKQLGKRKRRRQVLIRWYSADSVKVIQGITVSADVGSLPRSAQFPHPGNKSCHREPLMPILMRCPILETQPVHLAAKERVGRIFVSAEAVLVSAGKKEKKRPWQLTAPWSVSQIQYLTHGMNVLLFVCFIHPSLCIRLKQLELWFISPGNFCPILQSLERSFTETMLFFFFLILIDVALCKVFSCHTLLVSRCTNLDIVFTALSEQLLSRTFRNN